MQRKMIHEIYKDFKNDDYYCKKSKRKPYVDFVGLAWYFTQILSEGKHIAHKGNSQLFLSPTEKDSLFEFVEKTQNEYSFFLNSSITNYNNFPLDCLKSLAYTLMTFACKVGKAYLVSGTLCSIFKEIASLEKIPFSVYEFVKTNESICLNLSRMKSRFFKNIDAYAYYAYNTKVIVVSFFAEVELSNDNSYFGACMRIEKDMTIVKQDIKIMISNDTCEQFGMLKEFSDEYSNILKSILNCIIFISNPCKDTVTQERIAEISSKRSRREFQKRHYSSENYTEIDINVEKVRAFEQGKSWYRRAHPRWQRCGKDRQDVKLIFIAPQFPERKKLF